MLLRCTAARRLQRTSRKIKFSIIKWLVTSTLLCVPDEVSKMARLLTLKLIFSVFFLYRFLYSANKKRNTKICEISWWSVFHRLSTLLLNRLKKKSIKSRLLMRLRKYIKKIRDTMELINATLSEFFHVIGGFFYMIFWWIVCRVPAWWHRERDVFCLSKNHNFIHFFEFRVSVD